MNDPKKSETLSKVALMTDDLTGVIMVHHLKGFLIIKPIFN